MFKIIGADGREYGPISTDQLRQWLAEGRVNARTRARAEGSEEWKTLADFPEFADARPTAVVMPASADQTTEQPKTSRMAISSLVLGVLGMCGITGLLGLILGIVSLGKINKSGGRLRGRGFAIAGICVSSFMLLVCIPFMLIMAGMLLPALAKAKEKAQAIQCVNNMKQLGLAVIIYSADNDNTFPPAATWSDAIKADVGTTKVFQCPAHPDLDCAYAFNVNLDGMKQEDIDPNTVLIFESLSGWNTSGGLEEMEWHRHSQRQVNVAFADGSVRRLTISELDSLRWEP